MFILLKYADARSKNTLPSNLPVSTPTVCRQNSYEADSLQPCAMQDYYLVAAAQKTTSILCGRGICSVVGRIWMMQAPKQITADNYLRLSLPFKS